MHAPADWRLFATAIASSGITTNESCGLHVHLGAIKIGLSPEDQINAIKQFALYFMCLEEKIDLITGGNDSKSADYQMTHYYNTMGMADQIIGCASVADLKQLLSPTRSHAKINLIAIGSHGTVELRGHPHTANPSHIVAWADLANELWQQAVASVQAGNGPAVPDDGEKKLLDQMLERFQVTRETALNNIMARGHGVAH